MGIVSGQTRGFAHGAIDVGDRAAGPAYDVVMVVPDPRLIAGHGPRRLDTAYEAGGGQRAKDVVDGLMRDVGETFTNDPDDRVRVGVRVLVHRGENRHPGTRHTKI